MKENVSCRPARYPVGIDRYQHLVVISSVSGGKADKPLALTQPSQWEWRRSEI